jgi:hypothetical protein
MYPIATRSGATPVVAPEKDYTPTSTRSSRR